MSFIATRRFEAAKNLYAQKHYTKEEYGRMVGEVMTDIYIEHKYGHTGYTLDDFVEKNKEDVKVFIDYAGPNAIYERLEDLGYYECKQEVLYERITAIITKSIEEISK